MTYQFVAASDLKAQIEAFKNEKMGSKKRDFVDLTGPVDSMDTSPG